MEIIIISLHDGLHCRKSDADFPDFIRLDCNVSHAFLENSIYSWWIWTGTYLTHCPVKVAQRITLALLSPSVEMTHALIYFRNMLPHGTLTVSMRLNAQHPDSPWCTQWLLDLKCYPVYWVDHLQIFWSSCFCLCGAIVLHMVIVLIARVAASC